MRRVLSGVLVLLLLASCGGGSKGKVTVFAATSLTGAFTEIGKAFASESHVKVTFNFGASSALVQQIQERAAADVFASADAATMTKLLGDKNVDVPVLFAHSRLVLVTKPKNPAHITTLADLARAGVVSLCAPEVPCGAYAAQSLSRAGVSLDKSRVSRAPNAAAALSAVTDGDAVAAIVYVTDAKAAGRRVRTITIPDNQNVIANYPIAKTTHADNTRQARAFVKFVQGRAGQRILRRHGFLPA